jgi:hypothetical protein
LLNQPEWVFSTKPDEKPVIAVLIDDSYSMETPDAVDEALASEIQSTDEQRVGSTGYVKRSKVATSLQQLSASGELSNRYRVVSIPFATNDPTGQTNFADPLLEVLKDYQDLSAVVLASDGDWNSGRAPSSVATQFRWREVPIMSVPLGSQDRMPDIELLSFDLPSFGIVGKSVTVPLTIESSLPRTTTMQLSIVHSDGFQKSQEVVIQPMGRTSTNVTWKPERIGQISITASLPVHPSELIPANNQKTATIAIREEKLQVLVMESLPRWEYRYLRNALSRDPGVEVSCLLFHPGLSKLGGGKDYLANFPSTIDELAKYDVVFLGDVGLDDGQLTIEDCRLLKGLVQRQASGLVFMPGWQGNQLSLIDSPLGELMPVLLDKEQKEGWGSRTPSHFELTEMGRRSLLTRLADSTEDNLQVWENLPGFQWHAAVQRAKAGSEILAVHQESSNAFGRLPLLVTQPFGVGKVLFMGTDGAWRWRKGVEDRYHYRFWGQVVRWMAYQRNMATGDSMRFYYSPEQPDVGQTIFLNANVMETSGEPMTEGEVTARITSPSGTAKSIRFESQEGDWGAFQAKFVAQENGLHQVSLRSSHHERELTSSFLVQGQAMERLGKPARPEVLEELSRITRGQVLRPSEVEQTLLQLSESQVASSKNQRWQLWSHSGLAITLISVLAMFWIGRKMAGQI